MILIDILVNALAIIGLHVSTWDDMIFDKVARWVELRTGRLSKPLFNCPTCMASVWGVTYWLLFHPCSLLFLPVYILAVSASATFLNRLLPTDDGNA